MAAAFVQGNFAGGKAVTSLGIAFSSNNTAANAIIVGAGSFTNGSLTIADTVVNSYTLDGTVDSSALSKGRVWSAPNIGAGANTVTVTAGASTDLDMSIHEYSGLVTVGLKDVSAADFSNSSSLDSTAATTTNAADMLFGYAYEPNTGTITWTAGNDGAGDTYTLREKSTSADGTSGQSQDFISVAATGSYKATMTMDLSHNWLIVFVAYKVAGGGGGGPTTDQFTPAWYSEGNEYSLVGFKPWVEQHEVFAGDTSHTFVPVVPASTLPGVLYNEHLDHPAIQGWVFRSQQVDGDQSTNFIILPRPAWDTDADQQKAQAPLYGNLASDGGIDWTNLIVLPPFDPVNSLVEDELFTASQVPNAPYRGLPSDGGQDTTQFLIIPKPSTNLDDEHQRPHLPYWGLASDSGQDWTQFLVIPAFDPSNSLVAEGMFEAYQMYQRGSQGFGSESGADPGSWGDPASNVVVATAVMSYLNRFNPFNF